MIDQRDQVLDLCRQHDSFLIVSHENPDGDAIGASLALALALRGLGKRAVVYNVSPMPKYLEWLPGADLLTDQADPADFTVAVALDCGAPTRLGPLHQAILARPHTIDIDHHITNEGYGEANFIDPKASSTCELLFSLLHDSEVVMTPEIATNLYLGIYTDTMMFQNSAATPTAYAACGQLMAAGAQHLTVARRVYIETTAPQLWMLGRVLSSLTLYLDGRIAGIVCRRQDLDEFGLGPDDMETFIEYPRAIKGVEVAFLLREEDHNHLVKGSMRSNTTVDVSAIAQRMGGGGHKKAAGFRITGALEEIRERVVAALTDAVDRG